MGHPAVCLSVLEFPAFRIFFFAVSEKPSTRSMHNIFFKLQSLIGDFEGCALGS